MNPSPHQKSLRKRNELASVSLLLSVLGTASCTGQLPGSFRLKQQEQVFSTHEEINTKIDLLWVVDNSSSMDVAQEKIRNGFSTFAKKYLQPTWDIRVAVITTDTYLAHSRFDNYLNSTLPGSVGWTSPYIASRLGSFRNPAHRPGFVNLTTGAFDSGIRFNDLIPAWGAQYARLLPGIHDGPIAALCFEGLPYFFFGITQCQVRDQRSLSEGAQRCLNPNAAAGETRIQECLNTTQNDSNHSGKAILETKLNDSGISPTAWTNQLVNQFMINVTTGSSGHGSERGLGSFLQLLQDNENSNTAFFRKGSLRGILFVSDEDDQTLDVDSQSVAAGDTVLHPWTDYGCDQAGLLARNPSLNITGTNGLCCNDASNHCRYGSGGTSCASKTVDGYTYTVSICPKAEKLLPIATVKQRVDQFFRQLDEISENSSNDLGANYFVASIVALSGSSIQQLQNSRSGDDSIIGAPVTHAVDRGDRYIEFSNSVGNGSLALDIAASDYTPILDAVGRAIIDKKGRFTLQRAPTRSEEMTVSILHADGTQTPIGASEYTIDGKSIVLKDPNLVLSFRAMDQILINYQPRTVY